MNRPLSRRLVAATLAFLAGTAALSFGQSSPTAEQQILKADTDRFKAMVNGDVAMLERLLAVELSYIRTTGRIEDKHAVLYGIKSGKTKYSSIIPSERAGSRDGDRCDRHWRGRHSRRGSGWQRHRDSVHQRARAA